MKDCKVVFIPKSEVLECINSLKGYRGYVQFSHRKIDKDIDVFVDSDPKVEDEDGFIYEAHFANDNESVSIKQINDKFVVAETDISKVEKDDIQSFISKADHRVKMAQIWTDEVDENCCGFETKVLKAVVFAGFDKGGKS